MPRFTAQKYHLEDLDKQLAGAGVIMINKMVSIHHWNVMYLPTVLLLFSVSFLFFVFFFSFFNFIKLITLCLLRIYHFV